MPYAEILTSASKLNCTGGTFADTLTANTLDSLTFPQFNGKARITHMWGMNSDHVAEGELLLTRYESVHDQQNGLRFEIASIGAGAINTVGAHTFVKPPFQVEVFSGDTATIKVSNTANDDVVISYLTEFEDLPGVRAVFADWQTVQSLKTTVIGLNQIPVASATAGSYGTSRALNADDTRLSANKYYAILGCNVQTPCSTISLVSTAWGGQRIGLPQGSLDLDTNYWFVQQSIARQRPLIPIINANDAGNVLVQVADSVASTSPKVDWNMYELSRNPLPSN